MLYLNFYAFLRDSLHVFPYILSQLLSDRNVLTLWLSEHFSFNMVLTIILPNFSGTTSGKRYHYYAFIYFMDALPELKMFITLRFDIFKYLALQGMRIL